MTLCVFVLYCCLFFFFFKQKTAYEMRISDWSSDVCSSDLYYASLRLLESVKRRDPSIFTKSGIMLGLGEERMEVHQVMDDMRSADIDFMTMGQYLQPTPKHAKVIDFVTPQAFDAYAQIARAKGFLQVASSPLTR